MKEKSFRFRESFGTAINAMDDRQAGKFIKGLCRYIFEKRSFEPKDAALKSTFSLVKMALDQEEFYRTYGKQGGKISAEMRKQERSKIMLFARLEREGNPMEELLKTILSAAENEGDGNDKDENGIPEKQPKM